jgi:hypothetical protein
MSYAFISSSHDNESLLALQRRCAPALRHQFSTPVFNFPFANGANLAMWNKQDKDGGVGLSFRFQVRVRVQRSLRRMSSLQSLNVYGGCSARSLEKCAVGAIELCLELRM